MSECIVNERLERLRKIKEYSWYAVLFASIMSCAIVSNDGPTLDDYAFVGGVAMLLMIGGLMGILTTALCILRIRRAMHPRCYFENT